MRREQSASMVTGCSPCRRNLEEHKRVPLVWIREDGGWSAHFNISRQERLIKECTIGTHHAASACEHTFAFVAEEQWKCDQGARYIVPKFHEQHGEVGHCFDPQKRSVEYYPGPTCSTSLLCLRTDSVSRPSIDERLDLLQLSSGLTIAYSCRLAGLESSDAERLKRLLRNLV